MEIVRELWHAMYELLHFLQELSHVLILDTPVYIKNRVIPAFKDKYLGKRIILFMDNATTHDTRGRYPNSSAPKSKFAAFLSENGVTSIEVTRKTSWLALGSLQFILVAILVDVISSQILMSCGGGTK